MSMGVSDNKKKNQALRFDDGKPQLHYLHTFRRALAELALVCEAGAKKYERGNYLRGQPISELLNCAERHLFKYGDTSVPDNDPESGKHHLAHAAWNILQALESLMRYGGTWDDRITAPTDDEEDSSNG